MSTDDLDTEQAFIEALETIVAAALQRIDDDHEIQFEFFRRLLSVVQEISFERQQRKD